MLCPLHCDYHYPWFLKRICFTTLHYQREFKTGHYHFNYESRTPFYPLDKLYHGDHGFLELNEFSYVYNVLLFFYQRKGSCCKSLN